MLIEIRVPLSASLEGTLGNVASGLGEACATLATRGIDRAHTRIWGHRMRFLDGRRRRRAYLVYRATSADFALDVWGVMPDRIVTAGQG